MSMRYWIGALSLTMMACADPPNAEPDMTTQPPADMPAQVDMPAEVDMPAPTPDMDDDMDTPCEVEPSGLGPVMMCDEAGTTACFANSDCADNQRCENIGGALEVACCVEGPRGCKATGEACASEFECDEGLCVSRNDGPQLCSKRCEMDAECPPMVPECNPVLGLCVEAGE